MTTRAAQEQDREEMLSRMMRPRIWPRSVGELYARDDQPPPEFDDETTLYTHQAGEKYAWTQGKTIANQGRLMHLGSGMECQVYLKQGTIEGTPITYLSKHWPVQSAMRGFYPEMALYASTCFLRPLQGVLVSRIIGIYSAPGGIVSVAMEPPHPHSWYEASRAMPDSYKQRFLDAYTRLHALGILHGDIELRHMLVTEDDRIHLIDFGLAQVLREGYDVLGLKTCEEADLEREMRRVKFVLDYPAGYAEQEIQRATANEEAVARGEEEDKDAIPLRTLEEEWGRSATEGGRRFVIPTDIPIISGPRKKRYAVQIPRAGGEEAEVEQILTPSHKDGASSNETLVVKSDPDSPRPAAPAEPVVKKEEEDVKPVIKKEEEEEDAAPAVKKEEEVEPVIKDEPRDDAPPLVPVPSTSQKRGRDDDEEDASDSPTKRSRASPPPPPAPTPAAAAFGNLASARMLKTIAPTQRNWNAAKTGSIVDAFICRYMCIKVKQFPLTHMFPPEGVDAPVISYDKNTRELRPRDLARQLVHQQAHEAARRMCAANGGKPVTEKETLVFAGVYDVESIARFYLRTDDGGAFPSKTLPATVIGAAPAPVAGSSRAGAMPPPPPVTSKRARGAEPCADAESPPKRARRAAPAPAPVHIADRSPSPRLSPPRRIKSPDLPADTVLPPTLPLSELVVTAIFGKSTPKADYELASTRATLGRKTRKQRREERELDAEIAAEEMAAAAAAVPRVVVQSPTPGPARPLSVRPQAAERLAAPRRGRSRGATPKGR